ncbi:hypothetical protein HK100_011978 [Physocladia obscura]|uniref:UBC core domain-containing protein n=1 Tax=Physocladia obscura TaxID=109957 RepID=A0AAD5T1X1_9FUNG|nr:hypothetical protein HK100_011978 [Physocladia obscura]
MTPATPAARRLMRDLAELQTAPVGRVGAAPATDTNILEWHANIAASFARCPLHVRLCFPQNYPAAPPAVFLYAPLPHANVTRDKRNMNMYTVCLDMLGTSVYADPSATTSGVFPYSGWSSSYSVKSIMMQLQTFLLDDKKLADAVASGSIAPCRRSMELFSCPGCAHTPEVPCPPVAPASPARIVPRYIARPFVRESLDIARARRVATERIAAAKSLASSKIDADGWTLTSARSHSRIPLMNGLYTTIENSSSSLESAKKPSVISSSVAPSAESVASPILQIKTNEKRRIIRIISSAKIVPKLISKDLPKLEHEEKNISESIVVPPKLPSTCPFSYLPYEIMLQILNMLPVQSIIILSETSKYFYIATEDGYLWRNLYNSLDSKLEMKGSSIGDWKHVYTLQMNGIIQDLRCFHRKISFEEDVLGIPIEFTVNPIKKTIDYIHSTMDLLSYSAFREDSVRKTVWSEKFSEWMPLYLSYEHFQRGLPLLKKSLRRLCPHIISNGFDPIMVLEVLPKLMNTQIVLLCDNGLHNSHSFLENFFQIHRLFIEMVTEFPQLKRTILARLNSFAKNDAGRNKTACPSLGDLIPLLSVMPNPLNAWKSIGPVFLKESFERNVLWIGRHKSELATLKPIGTNGIEQDRIDDTFNASATSLKLWATYVALFSSISSMGSSAKLVKLNDEFYGRPSTVFLDRIRAVVQVVLECKSFDEILPLYMLPRLPFLTPSYDAKKLTEALRECVRQSLRKKYHTKTTNFTRIHASGVSKILRKGQSYRCAPGTRSVVMEGSWLRGGASSYLDSTVFLYDFDGKFIDLADFRHQDSEKPIVSNKAAVREGEKIIDDQKPLNVIFIVDVTGSMSSQIEGVKQMIKKFCDVDRAGVRIHIWSFTEGGDDIFVCTSPPGLSSSQLQRYVEKLKICVPVDFSREYANGDDSPENVVSAVAKLILEFDSTDNILAFLITDADPHHKCYGSSRTAKAETRWLSENGFTTDIYEVLNEVIESLNVTFVPILYNTSDAWYQQAAVLSGGLCLTPKSFESTLLSTGLVHILTTVQELSTTQTISSTLAETTASNLKGFNTIPISLDNFIPLHNDPVEQDRLAAVSWTWDMEITPAIIHALIRTTVERFSFNGAIRHSGDIIVATTGRAGNRVSVNVKMLPDAVQTLVFVMSSWTGTLGMVRDPEVRLFDAGSMTELCRYSFGDGGKDGDATAVVLCKLKREKLDAIWSVDAVGKVGVGSAQNYAPIKELIKTVL